MTYMEAFMKALQEALANMNNFLGETVIVKMSGSRQDLSDFSLTVEIPFIKSMVAKKDQITVEFYSASELTDEIYELSAYRYDETYYRKKLIKEGTILDEDKSVRWNREEVARQNEEINTRIKNDKHWHSLEDNAMSDIIKASANDFYMQGFSKETLNIIFAKAWEDGHSSGYGDVYSSFRELIDMFVDACKAEGYIS